MNSYLISRYDDPKVQNRSFYGTLNKVLQFNESIKYEEVVIMMIKADLVYDLADKGRLRFFSTIAIKPSSCEYTVQSRQDLKDLLQKHIDSSNISGEVDLLDDGKTSIGFPLDIEAIIVDNKLIMEKVKKLLSSNSPGYPDIFTDRYPRNKPSDEEYF